MNFGILRDVSADQSSNEEVCYIGKFYVGSELAFKLRNSMSGPRGREEKGLTVTEIIIGGGKISVFKLYQLKWLMETSSCQTSYQNSRQL